MNTPKEIEFKFVGIKPMTKQKARRIDTRPGYVRHYVDRYYAIMKHSVAMLAKQKCMSVGWKPTAEEVECEAKLYVPKGERSPDFDNSLSGIIDALQGIVYYNDQKISLVRWERFKNIRKDWEIELRFRIRG